MKTTIILILLLSIALANQAQSTNFLRVFDRDGNKIAKGRLSATTDSSVILKKENKSIEVPYKLIGYMITKRSIGHSVLVNSLLIGSLSAATLMIMNSAPTSSSDRDVIALNKLFKPSQTTAGTIGFIAGAFAGAPIGGIIGASKNRERFNVFSYKEEWEKVKVILDSKIKYANENNKVN